MTSQIAFPSLEGWRPTKETLHLYCQAVGVIPRTHAFAHPKWWHISLKVRPNGLVTNEMDLPDGGTFHLRMDLKKHQVVLSTSHGENCFFSMTEGLTSTAFGNQLVKAVSDLGLEGEYARERFENDQPRVYNPQVAAKFFTALSNADRIFKTHRNSLTGNVGQVQLWPHGFDLAFEWYGTRVETYEEEGKIAEYPSQLNLGFSPGDGEHAPYFYSNPWPFEAARLVDRPLPAGARWFNASWQGSILPYDELADDPNGEARLLAYARAVYEISAPTLMADANDLNVPPGR